MMNKVDTQYLALLDDILSNGEKKKDRTGVGTYSVFGRQMRFDMREGFPLLTTKKIFTKPMIYEQLWFLRGGDNIKYLVDNGVNIWNEWPHQRYMRELKDRELMLEISIKNADTYDDTPFEVKNMKARVDEHPTLTLAEFVEKIKTDDKFAKVWGDLGPVYGKQWVDWKKYTTTDSVGLTDKFPSMKNLNVSGVNQIANLIDDLKHNPDSRRHLVTAWNPGELDQQLLPPCHYAFQVWTRELSDEERMSIMERKKPEWDRYDPDMLDTLDIPKRAISLMFQMRSCDIGLGCPFDIASYGLLLSLIAHCVDMVPEELIYSGGDNHIYLNHEKPLREQIKRDPYDLPKIWLNPDVKNIFDFKYDDIKFIDYKYHPSIKMDIAI